MLSEGLVLLCNGCCVEMWVLHSKVEEDERELAVTGLSALMIGEVWHKLPERSLVLTGKSIYHILIKHCKINQQTNKPTNKNEM